MLRGVRVGGAPPAQQEAQPSALFTPHTCQVLVAQEKQAAAEREVVDLRAELERMRVGCVPVGCVPFFVPDLF